MQIENLGKDVWWKIFFILFDDVKNDIDRTLLFKKISETCNYWKQITISHKEFVHAYFYRYKNKFESFSSPSSTTELYPRKMNHNYTPESLISIPTKEIEGKMNEYCSFRNSDKDCLLEHIQNLFDLKEFQTNTNNEDVDIEAIIQSYNSIKELYDKIKEEDEKCTQRHHQTKNEIKDDVFGKFDRDHYHLPVEQFEIKLNDLIEDRTHLFDIMCKDGL